MEHLQLRPAVVVAETEDAVEIAAEVDLDEMAAAVDSVAAIVVVVAAEIAIEDLDARAADLLEKAASVRVAEASPIQSQSSDDDSS